MTRPYRPRLTATERGEVAPVARQLYESGLSIEQVAQELAARCTLDRGGQAWPARLAWGTVRRLIAEAGGTILPAGRASWRCGGGA